MATNPGAGAPLQATPQPAPTLAAAPPRRSGRTADWRSPDDSDNRIKTMQEDYLRSKDPDKVRETSDLIDHFYNTQIDLFESWATARKPRRYHVFLGESIKERFPPDRSLLIRFESYGRHVFGHMVSHERNKLLLQGVLLAVAVLIAHFGVGFLEGVTGSVWLGLLIAVVGLGLAFGLYFATGQLVQRQYRYELLNDALAASRPVLERTKDLHNIFTEARSLADQAETDFVNEGKGWGQRAKHLTRLSMWLGARMEYLERFVQMQLWRARREWFFLKWGSRVVLVLMVAIWSAAALWMNLHPGHGAESRWLAVVVLVMGVAAAAASWRYW
ncbi:hypothetical protein BH09PSE2_BH09PSE2_23390 [soil metagenome]